MKRERILVINPNSSDEVTAQITMAARPFGAVCDVEVIALKETPRGISTQRDADTVAPLVQARIAASDAQACIVACYSDPGVTGAREAMPDRIIRGIGEGSILHALGQADRFGIIALSQSSVYRQRRLVRIMGVESRYAGSIGINATAEQSTSANMLDSMRMAAEKLRDQGADTIILGCGGMAHICHDLSASCGVPVIEPTRVTIAGVLGQCMLKHL